MDEYGAEITLTGIDIYKGEDEYPIETLYFLSPFQSADDLLAEFGWERVNLFCAGYANVRKA